MSILDTHYMDREWELGLGFFFAILGVWLLWSAFNNRGKSAPWPISGFMPV